MLVCAFAFSGFDCEACGVLDCGWVLPVYAAVVLLEQSGEVFIDGCKGGEVDIFVVVGALWRLLSC